MMNEKVLTVKGRQYKIEFPNVRRFKELETMKQMLSNGMYGNLLKTQTVASFSALDMIDVEAFVTVMIPDLLKDMKCDSVSDMGLDDYAELKAAYDEQVIPWWNEIMDVVTKIQKK